MNWYDNCNDLRERAIFVVNPGGYIGESVKREIEYASALGKEIIYME